MKIVAKLFGSTWRWLPLSLIVQGLACSPQRAPANHTITPAHTPEPSEREGTAPASPAEPSKASAAPTKPSVSEVEARQLLNRLFREAGYRVVNDREFRKGVIALTLDGYDPEREVGYEYIAPEEKGTDVSPSERAGLREEGQLLVVEGGTLDELEALAQAFLAGISQGNPDP